MKWIDIDSFLEAVKRSPKIEMELPKYGIWLDNVCSNCGKKGPIYRIELRGKEIWLDQNAPYKYCPNCGARMEIEDEVN